VAIHVGIAGWSYEDWKGKVYPRGCKDMLAFCARYVGLLEVNSTFYATPRPDVVAGWVERTAPTATLFTAKLGQVFTHERRLRPDEVASFHDAMQPLAASGRLRALLAQFPPSFVCNARAQDHLARVVAAFAPLAPLAVEVRHASWQTTPALAFLRRLHVSLVHLDYPLHEDAFDLPLTGVHAHDLAYFRLHGRNAQAWGRRDAERDEVYDWVYSAAEVREVALRLRAIAQQAGTTLVVANNHFEGKAMKVALELMSQTTGGKVAVPDLLLATYPELVAVARQSGQGRLFGAN
jgi:uncharacterized protein YecE (DUF72 family)